jgi:hypothetical protein
MAAAGNNTRRKIMSRKTVSLALAVLLLAVVMIPAASAQTGGTVYISLLYDTSRVVERDQKAVLRTGWWACNQGLVRTFVRESDYLVHLDGSLFLTTKDIENLWGPIQPSYQPLCPRPDKAAVVWWEYPWEEPKPGSYELTTRVWTNRALTDGADHDGDGRPDMQIWEHVNTVKVTFLE